MGAKKATSPNTNGLAAHARAKAEETRRRVTGAIDRLVAQKQMVNFNAVSRESGVTKGYLYKQSDLRDRIMGLRKAPDHGRLRLVTEGTHDKSRTEKSREVLLAAKDKRIRELEEEVKNLKESLKAAYGQVWDKI